MRSTSVHATAPNRQGGFTLVEVMITAIVIAILALAAVPAYAQVRKTANIKSLDATLRAAANSAVMQSKVFNVSPPSRLDNAADGMAEQCKCDITIDENAGMISAERWNVTRVATVAADGTITIGDGSITTTTTTTTTPTGYHQIILASGPVAYWTFDDSSTSTVVDVTGHGHDGTGVGSIKTGKNGIGGVDGGTAFAFDGKHDFVAVPFDSELAPAGPWTLELWAHRTGNGKTTGSVMTDGTVVSGSEQPTTGFALYYTFPKGKHTSKQWKAETVSTVTATSVATSKWEYVVLVYTGSDMQLWVNGVLDETSSASSYIPNSGAEIRIGAGGSGSADYFYKGFLDEVAFYDRALTQNEIGTHYVAGQ